MALFKKTNVSEEDLNQPQFQGKAYRLRKKAMGGKKAGKRMAKEDSVETVIEYGKGGKITNTSKNKTKHRGKTTYGRHQGY